LTSAETFILNFLAIPFGWCSFPILWLFLSVYANYVILCHGEKN